jgi:outer membrane protein OmpA-like peptidoglycan-associated protein
MKKPLFLLLPVIIIFCLGRLSGQPHYKVSRAGFSHNKYSEFCPVLYEDQIVFTSNREYELMIIHENTGRKSMFSIFTIPLDAGSWNSDPQLLSMNLATPYNDGPAAFSPDGKMVVFSRNIDTRSKAKNVFDPNNTLGLFFAEKIDGEWDNLQEFKYNSEEYSITSPCFSQDGNYLYFASDMPGGSGGTDLYRSEYRDGNWSDPDNLGDEINSKGNEIYPFVSDNGDLFFASDGFGGLGKKDIYLTRYDGFSWITPVHLDPPINSKEDDFGLVTNKDFSEGFFSSSRGRSDDIYLFSTLVPQLYNCDTLLENNYCYEFWDDMYPGVDSMPVIYEWEFSDGTRIRGLKVEHCLPGAGQHWAKLNIIDNTTSNTFFTQTSMEFELVDHVQPYITSEDAGILTDAMEFSGKNSNLPGFKTQAYYWDFDDGNFDTVPETHHIFNKQGVYGVKLGLKGSMEGSERTEIRCVIKPVTIVADNQALVMHLAGFETDRFKTADDMDKDSSTLNLDFSLFEVNPDEEVFRVEVLSSGNKVMLDDTIFDPLREKYDIKEFYFSRDSMYSYTVGEYNTLMATYDVYADVVDEGFTNAQVKTYVLAELPTEVIAKINRDFAEFADANFEFNESEVSENSYPVLDQVVKIMEENPELMMEIAAHTDNIGSFEFNMDLSQKRAESIVNYLVSEGVDRIRLVGKGYGESRPIATNGTEEGRMQNRRVEFIILNE